MDRPHLFQGLRGSAHQPVAFNTGSSFSTNSAQISMSFWKQSWQCHQAIWRYLSLLTLRLGCQIWPGGSHWLRGSSKCKPEQQNQQKRCGRSSTSFRKSMLQAGYSSSRTTTFWWGPEFCLISYRTPGLSTTNSAWTLSSTSCNIGPSCSRQRTSSPACYSPLGRVLNKSLILKAMFKMYQYNVSYHHICAPYHQCIPSGSKFKALLDTDSDRQLWRPKKFKVNKHHGRKQEILKQVEEEIDYFIYLLVPSIIFLLTTYTVRKICI